MGNAKRFPWPGLGDGVRGRGLFSTGCGVLNGHAEESEALRASVRAELASTHVAVPPEVDPHDDLVAVRRCVRVAARSR